MKFISLALILFIVACGQQTTKQTEKKYPDPYRENFKGEPAQIELLRFILDSSGNLRKDSVHYELGEWKDGYLMMYTEIDSSGKNKAIAEYGYNVDGFSSSLVVLTNGKPFLRNEITFDAAGKPTYFREFDSTNKLVLYHDNLEINELGYFTKSTQHRPDSSLEGTYFIEYANNLTVKGYGLNPAGKLTYQKTVARDNGNIVADTNRTYEGDSITMKITRYTYQGFDSLQNWLQQTELNEAGKPVKVTKRKITYAKL